MALLTDFVQTFGLMVLLQVPVSINAKLEFLAEPEPTAVVLGRDLMLNCSAVFINNELTTTGPGQDSENVILTYQWEFDGQPVEVSLPRSLQFTNHSLFVPKMTLLDLGVYECLAIPSSDPVTGRISQDATVVEAYVEDFKIWPDNSIRLTEGDQLRIECVTGYGAPPPVVQWEKDAPGSVFTRGTQSVATYGTEKSGGARQISMKLELTASPEDSGNYYCVSSNTLTTVMKRSPAISVIVDGRPRHPYLLRPVPSSLMIPADVSYSINCEVAGWPNPTITWYKDGLAIPNTDRLYMLPNGTLYFELVQRNDGGRYGCVGENSEGSAGSGPVDVTATYIDTSFIQGPSSVTAVAGHSVTLVCNPPASVPTAAVSWYRDDKPFTPRSGEFQVGVLDNGSLEFKNVQIEDEGDYFCVAYNQYSVPTSRASNIAKLTVQGSPILVEPPVAQTIVKGDLLILSCRVKGSPLPAISWYKESRLLSPSDRVVLRSQNQEVHISKANAYDEGMYHCSATNIYGMVESTKVWIEVHIPPEVVQPIRPQINSEGSTVIMRCEIYGDPVPSVTWFKDNFQLDLSLAKFTVLSDGLQISGVKTSDAGVYKCHGHNVAGSKESQGRLSIEVSPKIIGISEDQRINISQPLLLYCEASGVPTPILTWIFNNTVVDSNNHTTESNYGATYVVSSVTHDNAGIYTCQVKNKLGQDRRSLNVFVQEKPTVVSITGDTLVNQGDTLQLTCQTKGIPVPSISWTRNGSPLTQTSDGQVSFPNPNSLVIKFMSSGFTGRFACMATNRAGKAQQVVDVYVQETPLAPFLGEVIPISTTSVNVTWYPPSQPSQGQPTKYILDMKEKSSLTFITYKDDISGSKLWYEVSGLKPATEYVFRVAAENIIGQGQYSAVVGATTLETAPGPPRNLRSTSHNSSVIRLSWEIPLVTNGDIRRYQIYIRKKHLEPEFMRDEILSPDLPLQHYTHSPLEPYTSYSYKVRAANIENGLVLWGEFTPELDVTTSAAVPSQPPGRILLTAQSSSKIRVSWQAIPVSAENGQLRGYTVAVFKVGDIPGGIPPLSVSPMSSHVDVPDLKPWIRYAVQVNAFNDIGPGPMGPLQTVRTLAEAPAGSPVGVQAWATSAETIRVQWERVPVEKRNCDISGYVVFHQAEGMKTGTTQYVGNPDTLHLDLRGLESYTSYSIKVQAFTTQVRNGNGPFSEVVYARSFENVPGRVTELTVEPTSEYLTLSWKSPSKTNGNLLSYVIFRVTLPDDDADSTGSQDSGRLRRSLDLDLSSLGGTDAHIVEVSISRNSWKMENLQPLTRYVVGVAAKTQAGVGQFTNYSMTTLPPTTSSSTIPMTTTTTLTPVSTVGEEVESPGTRGDGLELAVVDPKDDGFTKGELAGIILGSIIGGLLVLGLIILLCMCCCRTETSKTREMFSPQMITDMGSETDSIGTQNQLELQKAERRKQAAAAARNERHSDNKGRGHSGQKSNYQRVDPIVYQSKAKAARAARDAEWQGNRDVSSLAATASTSRNSVVTEDLSELGAHGMYDKPQSRGRHGATRDPVFTMSYPNIHSDVRGFENPGFEQENNLNRHSPFGYRSNPMYHSNVDTFAQPSVNAQHRRHMERKMAAAIAAQKNRETSVWGDTDELIDNEAVVVYNERTAL